MRSSPTATALCWRGWSGFRAASSTRAATLDGEPVLFDTPVEIRILDKAARVLRAEADH